MYFWSTKAGQAVSEPEPGMGTEEKSGSYEVFQAHNEIATVAIFAPQGARRCLPAPQHSSTEKASSSADLAEKWP